MPYFRRRVGLRPRYRRSYTKYPKKYIRRRSVYRRHYKSTLNKPEIKHYDIVGQGGSLAANPAGWSLFYLTAGIQQGLTAVTRVGNSIRINSVGVDFVVSRNASGNTVQRVRAMLVYMPQTFNSAPDAAEMFDYTNHFTPPRNLDYMKYYRILWDRTIVLDSAVHNARTIKFHRKCFFKARYTANGGSFTSQDMGGLYMVFYSDQASNTPALSEFNQRVCFSDL